MTSQEIKLSNDTLANIHIMAPLLTPDGREKAMAYMLGLLTGAKHGEADQDVEKEKTG